MAAEASPLLSKLKSRGSVSGSSPIKCADGSQVDWIDHEGTRIRTRAWIPEGTPVAFLLMVHGLGEYSGRYTHVFPRFCARGIHVLSFDIPGFGESDGAQGSCPGFDNIFDIMDVLYFSTPLDIPHFIMGHSMGGCIVLNYVLNRVVVKELKGVIVSAPAVRVPPPNCCLAGVARCLASCFPLMSIDTNLDFNAISRVPAEVARYREDPLVHGKIGTKLAVDLIDGSKFLDDEQAYHLWTAPILGVHGTADRLTNHDGTRDFVNSCNARVKKFVSVPDGYHELVNEPEKEMVMDTMIEWIIEMSTASL